MTDNPQDRTPSFNQQLGDFTANPRVRRVAGIAVKAYLIWGAFVVLLALVVLAFVGYEFLHIAG